MTIEDTSFEAAFGQLDQVVADLQAGDLNLDRAMSLFEEGMRLVRLCNDILDHAELRIRQVVPSEDGYAVVDLDGD